MRALRLLWLMIGLWLLAYSRSFWVFFTTPATGDSFTRGLNKLAVFMQWQMVAGGFAILIWIIGRRQRPGSLARWGTRGPGLLALLPVLAIVVLLAISYFDAWRAPATQPPTKMPVTIPID